MNILGAVRHGKDVAVLHEHRLKKAAVSNRPIPQEGKGRDPNGYRAGFIELVRKAQALSKG